MSDPARPALPTNFSGRAWAGLALLAAALSLAPVRASDAVDFRSVPRTYKIGVSTQVLLDGEEIKPDQLKVGLHATVVPDSFQDGYAADIDAHTISPQGGAAAAKPAASSPPAAAAASAASPSKRKHWTITAVSADSITVEYK